MAPSPLHQRLFPRPRPAVWRWAMTKQGNFGLIGCRNNSCTRSFVEGISSWYSTVWIGCKTADGRWQTAADASGVGINTPSPLPLGEGWGEGCFIFAKYGGMNKREPHFNLIFLTKQPR